MAKINIRKAVLSDLDRLLDFEQGVIRAERPFDSTLKSDLIHYYNISGMIEADHVQLVVAENEIALVGCGYARIEKSQTFLVHSEYAYLGFMYVAEDYRGQGINQLIVEALKSWAISRGITELRLEVYKGNLAAISAYEKAGFEQHLIEMRMGL